MQFAALADGDRRGGHRQVACGQVARRLRIGRLESGIARFGRSYTGEPDVIAAELAKDPAVQMADTVLLTVPNQLGVEYCATMLETIAQHVAPAIGWAPGGTKPQQSFASVGEAAPLD